MAYMGRRRIFSRYDKVDDSNVTKILDEALSDHSANVSEMMYLWKYFRGQQPILGRQKTVRPEICNNVVENHAQEVVNFKTGYQLSEPIQYICRTSDGGEDDASSRKIADLNTLMFAESSESKNRDLFEWMCICGVGYKFVEADVDDERHGELGKSDIGGAPFNIHIPNPWDVFIVYSSAYHRRPIMGVWVGDGENDTPIYTVYTDSTVYTIVSGRITGKAANGIGLIPIIEYDLNNAMMGVFESALPVLDAINTIESNRIDHIEQVVQALYLFKNCQIDEDEFLGMIELGAVSVSSVDGMQGDVSLITNNADQSNTQTVKEDLYNALVNICGMPNRNQGGANDTGSAVLLRDGWTLAESHAKSYELQFKKAERDFIRVVLRICDAAGEKIDLKLRDIDLAFNRRNYDNIVTKAQVLTTLLATEKVDPLDCYKVCGLFTDPSAAFLRGQKYVEELKKEAEEAAKQAFAMQQSQQPARTDGLSDHDGDGVYGEDNHGRKF